MRQRLKFQSIVPALALLGLAVIYRAAVVAAGPATPGSSAKTDDASAQLDAQFTTSIRPFLQNYCVACHGTTNPEADLDLSVLSSVSAVLKDLRRADLLMRRLKANEMPPRKA